MARFLTRPLLLLVLASLAGSPSLARDREPAGPSNLRALEECQRIGEATARLACYDVAGPALTGAAKQGQLAVVDREQVRKVRRSLFGFSVPKFPFFDRRDKADDEPKEIVSTIQSFSAIGNGRYRMAIGDGSAVWETTESSMAINDPKRGEKVTITRAALGSYFLQIGSQRWVRARRIR